MSTNDPIDFSFALCVTGVVTSEVIGDRLVVFPDFVGANRHVLQTVIICASAFLR